MPSEGNDLLGADAERPLRFFPACGRDEVELMPFVDEFADGFPSPENSATRTPVDLAQGVVTHLHLGGFRILHGVSFLRVEVLWGLRLVAVWQQSIVLNQMGCCQNAPK